MGHWPTNAHLVLSVVADAKNRMLIAHPGMVVRVGISDMNAAIDRAKADSQAIGEIRVDAQAEIFEIAKETGAELYGTIPFTAQPDSLGGVWYATYIGVVHIRPESVARQEGTPPVLIQRASVDGVSVPVSNQLILAPSARTLQIQAAPILLSSRPGLIFRSRLFGFDSDWSIAFPNAAAIYNRLPRGKYAYRLEARWAADTAVSQAEIELIQQGPFHRSGWSAFLMVLLAGALIWAVHRFRVHQLQLQCGATTAERTRVAREIHDTVLQGCIAARLLFEAYVSTKDEKSENLAPTKSHGELLDHARGQMAETIRIVRSTPSPGFGVART